MCKNKYKNLICIFVRYKNLDRKFLNYINSFHTFSSIASSNLRCVLFCNCICSTIDVRSYDKSSYHFQFTSISCSKLSNFFFSLLFTVEIWEFGSVHVAMFREMGQTRVLSRKTRQIQLVRENTRCFYRQERWYRGWETRYHPID